MVSINKTALAAALMISISTLSGAFAEPIQAIKITGNKRIESETILSHTPLKVGSEFDESIMNQALKDLFSTGYFTDVHIKREGSTLVIDVLENPIINRIAFEGNNKLKDDKLTEEVQLRPREVLSRPKIQAAQQRILDIYRRMGRFNATVEPKIIKLEQSRVDLVFEINEGDVTYVRKINFIGNKHISSGKLEAALLTKRYKFYRFFASDDTLDPDRFTADQQLLRQYYYDQGFPDFRLISAVSELSPDHKDFYLTFALEEGERYTFSKIDIVSQIPQINASTLKSSITFKTGDYFSNKEIEKTITHLTELLGASGYAFAEVHPKIEKNREKKTVDITFEIKEGPRVYVERIDVVGNDRTRDEVIRREITLHEGDAFNASRLKKTEKNLKDLGYFKKVELNVEPGSSPDRARVVVKVEEQSTGELGFAGGYSTLDGPLAKVNFSERNFMGTGRIIHTDLTVAQKAQEFDIGITDPYFLGYNLVSGVDLFGVRSTRLSAYHVKTKGGSTHIGYNLTENLSQTLTYTLKHDDNYHVDPHAGFIIQQQKGKFLTSSIGQALAYDRRNSKIDPTAGYIVSLGNTYAGVGGDIYYLRNSLGASAYYSPIEEVVLNVRGSAGTMERVKNKLIRVADSILLGADSFRGFRYGGIGPRDRDSGVALGGTRYWMGTVEMLFPIGLPNEFGVKGAVFTDFGTLWRSGVTKKQIREAHGESAQIIDHRNPRMSAGVGISWVSPFGPIKIDYTLWYKKQKDDQIQRFLIGFSSRF